MEMSVSAQRENPPCLDFAQSQGFQAKLIKKPIKINLSQIGIGVEALERGEKHHLHAHKACLPPLCTYAPN